jgi:8-oxo-dGTP pyrophosphatase MutT (NUDIX family)
MNNYLISNNIPFSFDNNNKILENNNELFDNINKNIINENQYNSIESDRIIDNYFLNLNINNIDSDNEKKNIKKYNTYCVNCNNKGHKFKNCIHPILSHGIICLHLNNFSIKKLLNKEINIIKFNQHISNKNFLLKNLKILLIRRRHSLSFVEYIRGRYIPNNIDHLKELFFNMTNDELNLIKNSSFKDLWIYLWNGDDKNFKKDYSSSLIKHNFLIDNNFFNLLLNYVSPYNEPEWGIPKGRRKYKENDIDCAFREFNEETNVDTNNLDILDLFPVYENYTSLIGSKYKNNYFISEYNSNDFSLYSHSHESDQYREVSDIKWFSFEDAYKIFRNNHSQRKEILLNIIKMILIMII